MEHLDGGKQAVAPSSRVAFVDALRGYALLGLLLVHSVDGFGTGTAREVPTAWSTAVYFLFDSKAFAIFALLFGFGFATIMANQRARGVDFTARFAWRLTLLFAVGTLHGLIYFGDILQVLALLGLLLIPLDRVRSNAALLAIAALCFLQIPLLVQYLLAESGNALAGREPYFMIATFFEVYRHGSFAEVVAANTVEGLAFKWSVNWSLGRVSEIAGLFAVGMVLQRTDFFRRIAEQRTLAIKLIAITLGITALLALFIFPLLPPDSADDTFPIGQFSLFAFFLQLGALCSITIQIGLLALLWNSPARRVVALLSAPGRMTLTLYIAHSLIAAPVLFGFGLGMWQVWSTDEMLVAGLVFFALQIAFAKWWYTKFRYGPLEWTWRAATLTDWKVPMRIAPRSA